MPKRVLAIGVGGSGKAALTLLKERLQETPKHVALLSFDTDDLREADRFAGVQHDGGREPEFYPIVSRPEVTMDTIFADLAVGRHSSSLHWLETDKLDRILAAADRDIRGGAQQRRPIGRVALFQRWADPIYQSILNAIGRIYGEPENGGGPKPRPKAANGHLLRNE